MGSRGRRAAESRVGDEEMEEENNRILVVKSDEKWMQYYSCDRNRSMLDGFDNFW